MERQLQHHPGYCHHLHGGGHLPPKTWPHFEVTIEMLQKHTAHDNHSVARDHQNGKPKRKSIGPFGQTQRDDRRQQQPLVCNGIKHGTKRASLTKAPGDPPVEAVCH